MKITFVLGHELPFPPQGGGGVNSLLHSLTIALAKLGHEVTAYSPSHPSYKNNECIDGVKHIRVKGATRNANVLKNVLVGLPYILRVRSAMQPCDILSCHILTTFLLAGIKGVNIITHTIHRDPKRYLKLMRYVNRIYTGSDTITEEVKSLIPSLAHKSRTVYNCVDVADYMPISRKRNHNFTFIFVGRFTRDKGIESFIKAFIKISEQFPEARLETIGPMQANMGAEPDFVDEMKSLVSKMGLGERVKFNEPIFERKSLDAKISSADVVCLPSLGGETLNMGILECARLSMPLIVSDLPANTPLVVNEQNGFIAKAGDVDDWQRIMAKMINLKGVDYTRMANESFNYTMNNFSTEIIAKRYIEDFDKLLKGVIS